MVIDVDATLADTHTATLDIYNKEHGTSFTTKDITDWDYRKTRIPIDYSSFMALYGIAWSNYASIKPLFDGDLLKELEKHYEIIIASKRPASTIPPLEAWLKNNLGGVEYTLAIYDSNGNGDKHEYGADFMIDDKPSAASDVKNGTFLFLVKQPYTPKSLERSPNQRYTVVKDVNDALRKLIDMAEGRLTLAGLRRHANPAEKERSTH